jgi:hypothetical protein
LFVDHTLRELNYFVARAFGPGHSAYATLQENLQFMAEHAHFAAQLCDPTERQLIHQALAAAGQFETASRGCQIVSQQCLELSRRAGEELDRYLTTAPLTKNGNSVIHPVLADHVVREGRRMLQTVDQLRAMAGQQGG